LPFCHLKLTAEKPRNSSYPKEIKTLGDHIRARPLELGPLQKQAAVRLGATLPSILNWEKNRSVPSLRFVPKIIEFLGYDPCADEELQSVAIN